MSNDNTPTNSPDAVLYNLAAALKGREKADIQLAEVLATHLLVIEPGSGAVDAALEAITKIANDRAALGEGQS